MRLASLLLLVSACGLLIFSSGCDGRKRGQTPPSAKVKKPERRSTAKLSIQKHSRGEVKITVMKVPAGAIDLTDQQAALQFRDGLGLKKRVELTEEELSNGFTKTIPIDPGDYTVVLETGNAKDENLIYHSYEYFVEVKEKGASLISRPDPIASPLIPGLDVTRLRLPAGIGKFWRDNNSGYPSTERVDEVLEMVNEYESMDQNYGYYTTQLSPLKTTCAVALARAGRMDEAMKVLEEVRERGLLPASELRRDAFDEVRETESFKALVKFAEEETEAEAVGKVSLVKKPYCKLEDLLKIKTTPALPSASDLAGEPVVVFTSPALSEMGGSPNLRLYNALKEIDVRIILILGKKPEIEVPESDLFLVDGDAKSLIVDKASIAWFANKKGEVVFANRNDLYDTPSNSVLVVEYLKSLD